MHEAILQTARAIRSSGQPALFRLAPTPSGFLHRGNLFNFLVNWLTARLSGSRILLRIDDLDQDRLRPEYLDALFSNLRDLQLDWDLGPASPQVMPAWSQQYRMELYREKISCLRAHDLVYSCACSRKDLDEGKTCSCRTKQNLPAGGTLLRWRENIPAEKNWSDLVLGTCREIIQPGMVLWRRDGLPAYQLASVTDDAHFGVTHVFRGEDLIPSTAFQIQLIESVCFAGMQPMQFGHHPLLTDHQGRKISKSTGKQSSALPCHESGFRQELFTAFLRWSGLVPSTIPIRHLPELLAYFVEKDSGE